jgi:N-acetylgalactosamine kinase
MADDGWDAEELGRARDLAAQLRAENPGAAIFAVRAPGRVNLIGEHTDYSGLPVLPVAIDRATVIAAAAREDSQVILRNADPAYPPRDFHIETKIPPYPSGDWANYAKAAVQGVVDCFAASRTIRGANLMVDGRVPPAAGLSSSAALTVASALALMAANGIEQDPIRTAQMVARSEWYVGTMAGGMDQAASMLGRRDHALFIQFDPLRATPVKMRSDAALVVADSLEVADKSGRVREEYNRRVIECALAARILGRAYGIDRVRILGDVAKRLPGRRAADVIATLASKAPARITGIAQAASLLDVDEGALRTELLGAGAARVAIDEKRPLEILRRARHVLNESERVSSAVEALSAGKLEEMGALMNASHQSLRDDFDASTPRLDAMVECASGRRARREADRRGLRRMHHRARALIGCRAGAIRPAGELLRKSRRRCGVARAVHRHACRPRRERDQVVIVSRRGGRGPNEAAYRSRREHRLRRRGRSLAYLQIPAASPQGAPAQDFRSC